MEEKICILLIPELLTQLLKSRVAEKERISPKSELFGSARFVIGLHLVTS